LQQQHQQQLISSSAQHLNAAGKDNSATLQVGADSCRSSARLLIDPLAGIHMLLLLLLNRAS
jgi:hypothetical protein